jgi:hypothetical protein
MPSKKEALRLFLKCPAYPGKMRCFNAHELRNELLSRSEQG